MLPGVNTKGQSAQERIELFKSVCDSDRAVSVLSILSEKKFFTSPASTKYHGAYSGGLFDHCMNVFLYLRYLEDLNVAEPFSQPDSPFIIGVLHDITKLGRYNMEDGKCVYASSNPYGSFGGHGSDSLIKAQQILQLTEEEAYCIRYHMGPYEKDDWDLYDKAIRKYPNVLWTHTADMVASKLMEVE